MSDFINQLTQYLFLRNPLFWLFMIVAFISYIFYKRIIGIAGEFWVKKELKKLNRNRYLIINDLTLKLHDKTCQIDHVVVSKYGIFVIETKQYNGYITGNEYDKKWVQNNKYYINNPIHQNYGHMKCLEEILNLPEKCFIPIVCIPSRAKLNLKVSSNIVLRNYNLNEKILSYTNQVIDNHFDIYYQLIKLNKIDKATKKEHVKYAKEVKKNHEYDSNKCPWCGGDIVIRHSQYGDFIGCKNYPKCHYKRNILN